MRDGGRGKVRGERKKRKEEKIGLKVEGRSGGGGGRGDKGGHC